MKPFRKIQHLDKTYEMFELENLRWSWLRPRKSTISKGEALSLRAPGAGEIQVIVETPNRGAEMIELTGEITGTNIAHVFFELLYLDRQLGQAYGPLLRRYLPSSQVKIVGGVSRPVWNTPASVKFPFRPMMRVFSNGQDTVWACLTLDKYPSAMEEEVYTVGGRYLMKGGLKKRRVTAMFNGEGDLVEFIVYTVGDQASPPKTIHPITGDQFIPLIHILTLPVAPGGAWLERLGATSPLTFGQVGITWQKIELMAGVYLAGFVVQDFDGNYHRGYSELVVE